MENVQKHLSAPTELETQGNNLVAKNTVDQLAAAAGPDMRPKTTTYDN